MLNPKRTAGLCSWTHGQIGDFGTSRWTQNAERSTGLATYTTNPGPSAAISFAWTAPEVRMAGAAYFRWWYLMHAFACQQWLSTCGGCWCYEWSKCAVLSENAPEQGRTARTKYPSCWITPQQSLRESESLAKIDGW